MTPQQKIKEYVLVTFVLPNLSHIDENFVITKDNVDKVFEEISEGDNADRVYEAMSEFRSSGWVETGIPCEWSRHYESKSVAAKMLDGSWVGWTYWYGGGKHGEPEAIDWLSEAYDLDCKEEEKLMVVRTFSKK